MISNELKNLVIQAITSWQVIGVTLGLIGYFSLVSYVAQFRRKPEAASKSKPKPKKEKKVPPKSEHEEPDDAEEAPRA
ncbi:hypothetical protein Holit_02929 [Hollandina sp. SP2]